MMKYLPYVLNHLKRNWIRTASTLAGLVLCIFLICVLQTVLDAIRQTTADADPSRLITRHAVSVNFRLPLSYKPRIQAIPGVRTVAIWTWFAGVYAVFRAFFHFKYLYETIKDSAGSYAGAGTYNIHIANPSQAAAVMRAIDANFENSDVQTKTETEGTFLAGFVNLIGNLSGLLNTVGVAVAFAILLVTANTMSMAVRERRTEIAVLKTLGFSGGLLMTPVIVEGLGPGGLGGIVGVGLAQGTVGYMGLLPFMGFILGNMSGLSVSPVVVAITFSIAVGVGVAAGFVPAFRAYRARLTDR